MAKGTVGRPAAFEGGTKMVRLPSDLAEMVSWLTRVEGTTAARIIDPLVRPAVHFRFSASYPDILAIKSAEDLAAQRMGMEVSPPLPEPISEDAKTDYRREAILHFAYPARELLTVIRTFQSVMDQKQLVWASRSPGKRLLPGKIQRHVKRLEKVMGDLEQAILERGQELRNSFSSRKESETAAPDQPTSEPQPAESKPPKPKN